MITFTHNFYIVLTAKDQSLSHLPIPRKKDSILCPKKVKLFPLMDHQAGRIIQVPIAGQLFKLLFMLFQQTLWETLLLRSQLPQEHYLGSLSL